jgi:hypothetical protein
MTAVEWLYKNLLENPISNQDIEYNEAVFHNAKEMEKQQGYSEEDMAESFMACWKANVPEGFECKLSFKEWFEQFKKKIR